jgi:hypothetical protein
VPDNDPAAAPVDPLPPAPAGPDPEQAADLDEAGSREPMHERDRAPSFLLRTQDWFQSWLSNESRIVLSLVIVILAVVALIVLSSFRFLRVFIDALDIVAFVGLFLVNWLGNGGVLVPVPGARFVGLLMIFQQAVLLPSWEVFGVAGAAMALGLLSYYIAGARTARSYAEGDTAGAEQLAQETGMLDDGQDKFAPAAVLEAEAASAIAGVVPPSSESEQAAAPTAPETRSGRLRKRFSTSLKKTQERAQPIIEQRGVSGVFLLCFAPTPMGTAAAYLGGLMRFGFTRYLLASFAAKYLLAGVIVLLGLIFSDAAHAVQIPDIELPVIDYPLFGGEPTPSPSPSPAPSRFPLPIRPAD